MKSEVYKAKPKRDNALLDNISKEALIGWFRCNSCLTCAFREEVVDSHPRLDIHGCARTHDRHNIIDMVDILGYTKE